jgi:hypothetical protein
MEILIIILLVILFGGGFGYYRRGYIYPWRSLGHCWDTRRCPHRDPDRLVAPRRRYVGGF